MKQTLFQEHNSKKTESFEEQIMLKDKYLSLFLLQCVYYPSNLFHNAHIFENWGIYLGIPQF